MTASDLHQRAGRVFLEACERPAAEREAFLAEACGGDAALLEHVRVLLEGDRVPEPSLEVPALEALGSSFVSGEHPERIGGYRILSVLGQGGMGIVYEAEQDQPRRRVALKVVRAGFLTEQHLRRFEHEARVLGWLNHPGIAQIYEAGTAEVGSGLQPFFAMERVEGVTIDRWVREQGLDLRARLGLLVQVCEALHHAHQKGVIHRDLKPSNVLVDARGQPKVLDFGVARATDADLQATTQQTAVGELVGTLPYMSPEQVSGDPSALDVRSDVYGLGVLAFELLIGRRPFQLDGRNLPSAVRTILEEEPTRLGTIDRSLRGDVETIVGKALAKEKTQRYASAEELGADMRRFLADEPIVARPPSATYQLKKFARRNRALVGGVVAVFAVLIVGVIVSTSLFLRAERARGLEEAAAEEARQAREAEHRQLVVAQENLARAETAEALARDEALRASEQAELARREALAATKVSDFLVELFRVNSPSRSRGRTVTAKEILDRGAERIAGELEDQPEVRSRLLLVMGEVYGSLGLAAEARGLLERALADRRELHGEEHLETARAKNRLAATLGRLDRLEESIRMQREALAVLRRELGDGHREVAEALSGLGLALRLLGELDESEAALLESLRVLEADEEATGADRAELLRNVAYLRVAQKRFAEARDVLLETQEILREAEGEEHPLYAGTLSDLGWANIYLDDFAAAEQSFRRALELMREIFADDHPSLGLGNYGLGTVYHETGRFAEAEPLLREGLANMRTIYGDRHSSVSAVLLVLGALLEESDRLEEAEAALREALEIDEAILPPEHTNPTNLRQDLAFVLSRMGRLDEAAELHERSIEHMRAFAPDDPELGHFLTALAEIELSRGDVGSAEAHFREALAVLRRPGARAGLDLAYALEGLAWLLAERGELEGVEALVRELQGLQAVHLAPGDPRHVVAATLLAQGLQEAGDLQGAEAELLRCLESQRAALPAGAPQLQPLNAALARLYDDWGRPEDSQRYRGQGE